MVRGRRRRGRRGGRRRRRHEGAVAGAVQNEQLDAQDLDDEDRDDPSELEADAPQARGETVIPATPRPVASTPAPEADHAVAHAEAPYVEVRKPEAPKPVISEAASTEVSSAEPKAAPSTTQEDHVTAPLIIAPAPVPSSFNLPVLPPIPVREPVSETTAVASEEATPISTHGEVTASETEVVTVSVPHGPEPTENEATVVESFVPAEVKHAHEPVLVEPAIVQTPEAPEAVTPAPIIHQPEQGDLLSTPLRHHASSDHQETKAPEEEENLHLGQQRDNRHS